MNCFRHAAIFLAASLFFPRPSATAALQIDSAALLSGSQLRLAISGETNSICIIETSTNLTGWTAVTNIFNSAGAFGFTNFLNLSETARFFRVHAVAQIPPTQSKTNIVRIPASGNQYGGLVVTTVNYQPTSATATAATGNTILLGKGFEFRLT
ncbi:MAG: hypothetical protein ABJC04_12585, partial [Verrucomicrobiota bacterium]